jgi:RNA polymerase sigma-70 factor (ECF subfamily)
VELPWLQPFPDRLLDLATPSEAEPEAVVTSKETVELAFLAAIQHLPPRQRAVLIVRDVLLWSAKDTAATLAMSQAAVNSALQRARATLAVQLSADRDEWTSTSSATERIMLDKLIGAWERADASALVSLLRDDVRLVMPPRLTWFDGRAAVETFLRDHVFGLMGTSWRLLPTSANRQPAFGLYWQEPGGATYRPFGLGVLRVRGDAFDEIAMFGDVELFSHFDLPRAL